MNSHESSIQFQGVWGGGFFFAVAVSFLTSLAPVGQAQTLRDDTGGRGTARATVARPSQFPHRIWAACDFEAQTPDYAWFGSRETENIPRYPGNVTALLGGREPANAPNLLKAGMNPVPGPMMGTENHVYLRYLIQGTTQARFQHYSLSTNDNCHIDVTGLTEGRWSEISLNFSRDAQRNDGTPGVPFAKGERMDDFQLYVGQRGGDQRLNIFIDDVIFFANEPDQPAEVEPFPNRVIYLAGFDTGTTVQEKPKYWPGDLEIVGPRQAPDGAFWSVARAVPRKEGAGKFIRLQIAPPKPVGQHTKLRFRYHLSGPAPVIVQIFDATDQDNRHVRLNNLKQNQWETLYVDFTRDGQRNDGSDTPLAAGHIVDDLFFFLDADSGQDVQLMVDEVVLFDAGEPSEPDR